MNTLEQVLLLEQKVQSAVEKIKQLQAENDALRSKCAELTNAVSSKSEQLKSFESDKNLIQSGIQKALDHLNSIEYSVLDKDDQVLPTPQPVVENPVIIEPKTEEVIEEQTSEIQEEPYEEETVVSNEAEEITETNTFQVKNPIELENKLTEDFNSSSPAKFEIPNFFGAPESYPLNDSFDTMKPVDKADESSEENLSPFGNDFGTDFDNTDIDEDNPDNELGIDFC